MQAEHNTDAMGAAIRDYHRTGRAARLRVLSSLFDEDEIPVPHLFRAFSDMPPLEQAALNLCRGRVLDVGAGAGCHSLVLTERGLDVTSVDVSPLACEVMTARGLHDVHCCDVMDSDFYGTYDTILLLMNGIGMAGTITRLPFFLARLKQLLAPGGQILTDSSDIRYVFENEDGSLDINLNDRYYGEVDYRMCYKGIRGPKFDWLYIALPLLQDAAAAEGMTCRLVSEGEHYDYLACITTA